MRNISKIKQNYYIQYHFLIRPCLIINFLGTEKQNSVFYCDHVKTFMFQAHLENRISFLKSYTPFTLD